MCFYCGKCLRDWQDSDRPMLEHDRWSPSCVYLWYRNGPGYRVESAIKREEDLKKDPLVRTFSFTYDKMMNMFDN